MGLGKYVINDGVKIYYEIDGEGPTIIMRTGAGGDRRIWRDAGYVAGLPGYKKILMDQRGRGLSDCPRTFQSHKFDLHVEDVLAVLNHVGVESTAFVGYSAGAFVGIAFGAAHPTRLKAIVGIGSLSFTNWDEVPKPPDRDSEIKRITASGGVKAEYEAYMEKDGDRFPEPIHQNVLGGDPYMRALDDAAEYDWHGPLAVYPFLRAPTLMLTGEKEDFERQTEKSVEMIPKGELVRLPGIGHLSAFYRSDLTLPHMIPFIGEHHR